MLAETGRVGETRIKDKGEGQRLQSCRPGPNKTPGLQCARPQQCATGSGTAVGTRGLPPPPASGARGGTVRCAPTTARPPFEHRRSAAVHWGRTHNGVQPRKPLGTPSPPEWQQRDGSGSAFPRTHPFKRMPDGRAGPSFLDPTETKPWLSSRALLETFCRQWSLHAKHRAQTCHLRPPGQTR